MTSDLRSAALVLGQPLGAISLLVTAVVTQAALAAQPAHAVSPPGIVVVDGDMVMQQAPPPPSSGADGS